MNKTLTTLAFGSIVTNLVAIAAGAYYMHRLKMELETELENAKAETNQVVHKIGKAFSQFEV